MQVNVKPKLIFALMGGKIQKVCKDVKVNLQELQHRLVVVDLNKKILKKIVRKKRIVKRMRKLNENRRRVKF